MTEPDPLERLRAQVAAAAEREMPQAARRRRIRWRAPIVVLAVLAGSAGVATAVNLISIGSEHPGNDESARRYGSQSGAGTIAVSAADPGSELPWGVLVYAKGNSSCAIVGQVRGEKLGLIRDGSFHPFGSRSGAACGDLKDHELFYDLRPLGKRSLVYGRAAPGVKTVELVETDGGRRQTAQTGSGGAFLFVFDAGLSISDFRVKAGS